MVGDGVFNYTTRVLTDMASCPPAGWGRWPVNSFTKWPVAYDSREDETTQETQKPDIPIGFTYTGEAGPWPTGTGWLRSNACTMVGDGVFNYTTARRRFHTESNISRLRTQRRTHMACQQLRQMADSIRQRGTNYELVWTRLSTGETTQTTEPTDRSSRCSSSRTCQQE
jgi:hypothetical protein